MNWKKWKMGLLVAIGTGIFQALAGLVIGITLKQAGMLFALNVGSAGVLYLKQHPFDSVSFDTVHITKTQVTETTVKTPSKDNV
jgi:hypothetical protein